MKRNLLVSGVALLASLGIANASVYDWSTTAGTNSGSDAAINWQEGQLPSTVNDSARAMMAALKSQMRDMGGAATLGGAGNAFALTLSQSITTRQPAVVGFFATRSNTSAVTLQLDSTTAAPLRSVSGTELVSGQIVIGAYYIVSWNSATSEYLIIGRFGLADSALNMNSFKITSLASGSASTDAANIGNVQSYAATYLPPGAVMAFAMSCPTGWSEADGTTLNRTTDVNLFTQIGTTWGVGDGSTTFNKPDFRGQFLRGWDHGKGVDTGRAFASSQTDAFASHNHTITDPGHTHTVAVQASGFLAANGAGTVTTPGSLNTGSSTTGITINNTGGTETRPKNYAVIYCIRQ